MTRGSGKSSTGSKSSDLHKCQLGRQEVKWFGNIYSRQGMSPDPEKVVTIKNWPAQTEKSQVKSFLQTTQFCSPYMRVGQGKTYIDLTKPLRKLTNKSVRFKRDQECQHSFDALKDLLCADTVLVSFDPSRATRLYVDHGPDGLGSTIAQKYDVPGKRQPDWRPVVHHSRALKSADKGYSKVEGESLGLLSGMMIHKQYLYGCKFEAVTDHLPLLAFYNSPNRPAPVRVEQHRSKLRGFRFRLLYESGNKSPCDYGSRHPPPDHDYTKQEREEQGLEDEEEDQEHLVNRLVEDNLPPAVTMVMLKQAMQEDKMMKQLLGEVETGKASHSTKQSEFSGIFQELTANDGVLLKGDTVVIPTSLQANVIALAHEGHSGGDSTAKILRERVWSHCQRSLGR